MSCEESKEAKESSANSVRGGDFSVDLQIPSLTSVNFVFSIL